MYGASAVFTALLAISTLARAGDVAFVACPIVRDTDPPCWFAEYEGTLYYLGAQQDTVPPVEFYPPQLRHRVLVEATDEGGEAVCGGVPLRSVRVSVLRELDPSCDRILPPEGHEPPPTRRKSGPAPTGVELATAHLDARGGAEAGSAVAPVRERPRPPYRTRRFDVEFDFDDDFLYLVGANVLNVAAQYFLDTEGQRVDVTVYRDRVDLTSGQILEERPEIVALRRDRIRSILVDLGVPEDRINESSAPFPQNTDRRAVLEVVPCQVDCPPPPAIDEATESQTASSPEAASYSSDSKIGDILDDPDAKAVLISYWPNASSPQIYLARGMTLRRVAQYRQSGLTEELLEEIDHGLATMTPKAEADRSGGQ